MKLPRWGWLCCMLSSHALAGSLNTDLLYIGDRSHVRAGAWNPDNFLRVPSTQDEWVIVIEGQESWSEVHSGLSVHGRARLSRRDIPHQKSTDEAKLQELSIDYAYRPDWLLSIGKTQLHWDNSSSSQPLGFFQQQLDVADLKDNKSLSTGVPLLALTHILPSGSNATLVYAIASNNEQSPEQWAFKWGWELGDWSPSLIVQKPAGQQAGWGGQVSWALSDYQILYGSIFTRQGTRLLRHNLLGADHLTLGWQNPIQASRLNDARYYTRGLVGTSVQWDGWTFLLEVSHDERKLSTRDWWQLNDLVSFHQSLIPQGGDVAALALLNLAYDNQQLSAQGARQNYAYFYVAYGFEQLSLRLFAKTDPEFLSSLHGVSAAWQVHETFEASVSFVRFSGQPKQEFSVLPLQHNIELVLSYRF